MTNYLRTNKYLLICFILSTILLYSCAGGKYNTQQSNNMASYSLPKIELDKQMYACQVAGSYGVKKYSFSGILFIKQMEDSSTRVVFQNEMGFNFFDFEWDKNQQFKVVSIQEQMNKDALIKTLQKDFEVMLHFQPKQTTIDVQTNKIWGQLTKGKVVHELNSKATRRSSYILSDQNKKIVSMIASEPYAIDSLPKAMEIIHHTGNFKIKIQQLITEE